MCLLYFAAKVKFILGGCTVIATANSVACLSHVAMMVVHWDPLETLQYVHACDSHGRTHSALGAWLAYINVLIGQDRN